MTIVLSSYNQGKLAEIKALLAKTPFELISLSQVCSDIVLEEGSTSFEENALLKARAGARASRHISIADDSGLEVDALDGRPGVITARFAGEDATDQMNMDKLLEEMKEVPDDRRTARFVCVAACAIDEENGFFIRGECEGMILRAPRGDGGFGYDPLFYIPEYGKTFAQLDMEIKNQFSHRARAFRLLGKEMIKRLRFITEKESQR